MDILLLICRGFLWLMAYSFLGWVYESILCSITERRWVNRGFLNGPLCPIYGFGAVLDILVFGGREIGIFELFLAAAVLTTTLEYVTSWAMEKLFHARWWDYSQYRFQINGRVCLAGFLAFGAFSVVLLNWLHPFVDGLIGRLSDGWMIALAALLFVLLILDICATVWNMLKLNHKLEEIQSAINSFVSDWRRKREAGSPPMRETFIQQFESSKFYTERIKRLLDRSRLQERRMLRAFPKLTSLKYKEALERVRAMRKKRKDKSGKK